MRPIKLTLQAFGSYIDRTEIDFKKLGENRIFLISGPTGGGKTTLLDAMCFALYCRATGGRRNWAGMRATGASPDQETLVDFEFSLGEERYRFYRSRSFYKGRGTEELKSREEHACYHWVDSAWSLMISGAESRVREAAQQLLGLTCEQFSQVIVLPQGDFLKLLLSNSREKAEIFQTLFATSRWDAVAKRFVTEARELTSQLNRIEDIKNTVLHQNGAETPEQLEEYLSAYRDRLKVETEQLAQLEKKLQAATDRYTAAQAVAGKFVEKEQLAKRLQTLRQHAPEMERLEKTLQLAEKTQAVVPHFSGLKRGLEEKKRECELLKKEQERLQKDLKAWVEKEKKLQVALQTAEENCAKGEKYVENCRLAAAHVAELSGNLQRGIEQNAAASLAAALKEGEPCPVCGAVHHPQPAQVPRDLEMLRQELEKAEGAARQMEKAQLRLNQRRTEAEQARKERDDAREQQMKSNRLLADTSAKICAAEQAVKENQQALQELRVQLEQQAKELGVNVELDEILVAPNLLTKQREKLEQYKGDVAGANQRLTELSAELAGLEKPELQPLREKLEQTRRENTDYAQQMGALRQKEENGVKALNEWKKQAEASIVLEQRQRRTARLAQLLSGKNARKIPLQLFVLGIMLDDVLTCANGFFSVLSNGRYSLNRQSEKMGGNSLSGLDIEVLDAQVGGARAVETLSGGELFLASLSLAFGLSEVVQNYSGGVRLDSIFIDEGFGSLDQETLDTAMRALSQLQSSGRMVGIISHVSELKSRIAAQIVVHKTANGGSSAEVWV